MVAQRDSHQEEAGVREELFNGISYIGNKGPWFGARHSIIIISTIGNGLATATKVAFSVVIVAMINNTTSNANIPVYDWNNQGVILSSVMWLGIPIQLVAGDLGRRYGHKWFIMGSVAANGVLFMLIPAFAKVGGSVGVIICRFLEGGILGLLGPVSAGISGLWIPVEERAKLSMIGVAVNFLINMLAYVLIGQIAASSWGYPGCCYVIGGLNVIWCILWYFLGFQSPATHPRITLEERKYIEASLNLQKERKIATPWLKLLTSMSFWAPVVAAIGINWIDTIMSTVNLLYVTQAWKIDIATSTSTIAVGPLLGVFIGILLAPLCDYLIQKKYLRIVNARRIFHTVGITGCAISLLWMTWIPAGSLPLIILNLSVTNIFTITFNFGGAGINILDIAPTLAGVISGFASTVSQCLALFAPMLLDWVVLDDADQSQWRILFLITAAIAIGTTIFFDIFASDKRKWDNVDEENTSD